MCNSLRRTLARLDVKRLLVVLVAIAGMSAPRVGRPQSPVRPKALPVMLATLGPVRPRRRFPVVKPTRPLPPLTTDDGQAAVDAIRRIARVVRLAGHEAQKRVGMTAAQLAVLRALDNPQPSSITDLADRTLTNPSSVSEVVARLVSQGLISRARSQRDARSVELSLTEGGRLALTSTSGPDDQLRTGLDQMPSRDRRHLSRLLGRLLDKLGTPAAQANEAPVMDDQVARTSSEPQTLSDASAAPTA